MLHKYKASGMSHLIDDFFFIAPAGSNKCLQDVKNFEQLCKRIGVSIKTAKTIYPTASLTIYGIEVDSVLMEARLPQDKLINLRAILSQTRSKQKIKLKDLQSLIGHLNFACNVVTPGRAFLRRLIDLTCKVNHNNHFIRLNCEARADIQAWFTFIDKFSGKSIFLADAWQSSEKLSLYTDASGALGYAAVLGSHWFVGEWTESHKSYQIAIKELFPIVLALEVWSTKLKNHKILFFSDNKAVVDIINKQSSKDKILMRLIRRLVLCALKFNILFRAKHIAGTHNVLADRLSRFQFQEAKLQAPWLHPTPTTIPSDLVFI